MRRGRTQGTGALHPTLRAQRCVCVLRLGYNVRGDASVVSRRGAGFRYVRDVDEIRSIPPRTFVLLR
jgi:hypothetical protein